MLSKIKNRFLAVICDKGRSADDFAAEGTGDRLIFQTGPSPNGQQKVIPMTEAEVGKSGWVEGGCFYAMGKQRIEKFQRLPHKFLCLNKKLDFILKVDLNQRNLIRLLYNKAKIKFQLFFSLNFKVPTNSICFQDYGITFFRRSHF